MRFLIILTLLFVILAAQPTKKTKKIINFGRNKTSTLRPRPTTPKGARVFNQANNTRYKGQAGSLSVFSCPIIDDEANVTVQWLKVGENGAQRLVLTTNNITNHYDKRFLAKNEEGTNHWYLRIRYTNESDRGHYICRVSGELSSELFCSLQVIRAHAIIIGQGKRKVIQGYPLRLSCFLKYSIERPKYIFWYKNDQVINYDLKDGANVREGRQGSELIFPRAEIDDAGNYSCVPSNADQASVIIEIL